MGLVKLAMIGGAGYFIGSHIKNQKGCGRRRGDEAYEGPRGMTEDNYNNTYNSGTRAITPEKHANPYNNGSTLPAYATEQQNNPPTYPNEKSQAPQYQQMTFSQPSHPYHTGNVYNEQPKGTTKSIAIGSPTNDTMAEAMRYLDAGDQEKARQILASAVGRTF